MSYSFKSQLNSHFYNFIVFMTYLHYSHTRVKARELTESALCPGETPQYVDLTFAGHYQCTQAI